MKGILIDETGDLQVAGGTLIIGECSGDVAERVLRAYPGEFKEEPTLGLFAVAQLNGKKDPFWSGKAKRQLRSQGIEVESITMEDGGTITIKTE